MLVVILLAVLVLTTIICTFHWINATIILLTYFVLYAAFVAIFIGD